MNYRTNYRVYCVAADGRHEFGIDYTRAMAIDIAGQYRKIWPGLRYYARKVRP